MKKLFAMIACILMYLSSFSQERKRLSDWMFVSQDVEIGISDQAGESHIKDQNDRMLYAAKSANGNCNNASLLSNGTPQCYNFSTDNAQSGETSCISCAANGLNFRTIWYVFQAPTNQTTINLNTNSNYWSTTWSIDNLAVYGPYTSQANATANCMPPISQRVACIADYTYFYDPLFSYTVNTNPNAYYLVQITNCEDFWDTYWHTGCVWFNPTPANNTPLSPAVIDACGITFNGTNIGYSPSTSNGLPAQANVDNNISTTCAGCPAGADVPYVINNDSWFRACAATTSSYNVRFNNITNCINNQGLQMTIFRGSPTNFTTIWTANNPSLPGSSQTSPNFTLSAGECVYLLVDGFAGDQCNYSYVLTAVTPCLVLGARLHEFNVVEVDLGNLIKWQTEAELDLDFFAVEHSSDGINWRIIHKEQPKNNSYNQYEFKHSDYAAGENYYRIVTQEYNGTKEYSSIRLVANSNKKKVCIYSVNSIGQKIDPNTYKGLIVDVFDDGSTHKRYE